MYRLPSIDAVGMGGLAAVKRRVAGRVDALMAADGSCAGMRRAVRVENMMGCLLADSLVWFLLLDLIFVDIDVFSSSSSSYTRVKSSSFLRCGGELIREKRVTSSTLTREITHNQGLLMRHERNFS